MIDAAWSILRRLPPRLAYEIVHSTPPGIVKWLASREATRYQPLGYKFLGMTLDNPVGLAAGLDKDGDLAWLSYALGLGYTVVGSVLPHPHRGAERKILKRLPGGELVNRLGLPSKGVDYVVARLARDPPPMPVAVNIAALEPEGYPEVYRRVSGVASWVEVNVSCPNTVKHGTFERPEWVRRIIQGLKPLDESIPVLVKLPPVEDRDLLWEYADAVREAGADGVVASNTLKVRVGGVQAGLSGNRLYRIVYGMVRWFREHLPGDMVVVGVGGIIDAERAIKIMEYADSIELLTALLYYGPGRVREIVERVVAWLGKR